MRSVSLIVPFRPDGGERDRNWGWLADRYRQHFPDWELQVADDPGDGWHKGRATNTAVEQATGRVLVIADADVAIFPQALRDAVAGLHITWVVPHGGVYRLNEVGTRVLMRGAWPKGFNMMERLPRKGAPGGGIVVIDRDHYEAVGGIDERFEGWGGEDLSFGRALDTLVGPHIRLRYPLYHMWHRPQATRPGRRGSQATEQLAGRYRDAHGDPAAMEALCRR